MMVFILILVILLAIVIAVIVIFSKIRGVFRQLFNNKSLRQVIDEGNYEEENSPKSVSSMTSLLLPQIQREFPSFSWDEYKLKAANVLTSCLLAVSNKDLEMIPKEANSALVKQIENAIEDNNQGGVVKTYDDIKVHKSAISRYSKANGMCTIIIQSAVEYRQTLNKVVKKKQTKYEQELIYVQDSLKASQVLQDAQGLSCPHCGAPVRNLGQKYCEYCNTAIIEYNDKVWSFGIMKEL